LLACRPAVHLADVVKNAAEAHYKRDIDRDPNTSLYHFFFQAEDGIRDRTVTGVQTCALPILPPVRRRRRAHPLHAPGGADHAIRSEERRVGKECRGRGWAYDSKKKGRSNQRISRGSG